MLESSCQRYETLESNSWSALFGGGFNVEGHQMTAQLMKCCIEVKERRALKCTRMTYMYVIDAMTGNMRFRAKIIYDNGITRFLPDMKGT